MAGAVSNNKGINLPGVAVNVPALSEKDESDLRWGLRLGADWIALSFVRNASDIQRVHEIMAEEGVKLPVVAKIEKPAGERSPRSTRSSSAFDAVGRPRRPGRRAAPRGRADRAEGHRPEGQADGAAVIVATQMLVDDGQPGPDPR